MFDHVSIGVADIARSKKFYDAALKPLGFTPAQRRRDLAGLRRQGGRAVARRDQDAGEGRQGVGPAFLLRGQGPRRGRRLPCRGAQGRRQGQRQARPARRLRARTTMPPSPSIPTATASRRIAGSDLARFVGAADLGAMATPTVETATAAEEAAVFAILTLAFGGDPATRWTWPEPKAYLEAFPRFAKAFGGAAFAQRQRPPHRLGRGGAVAAAGRRAGRGGDRRR